MADRGPERAALVVAAPRVACGLWLLVAPLVLGYGGGDPYANDVLLGALVAVLALARAAGRARGAWPGALEILLGVWLFASAFLLDASRTAGANDVVLGVVVFVLGLLEVTAERSGPA